VSNVLSRLKKKGLISKEKETWKITRLGKEMLMHKNNALLSFIPEKPNKKQKKTTIIVFDIPEKKRKYRDWLRYELIGLGFEFVQQSVWFGPTLPQEFVVYLEKVKLIKYTRFFKVKEGDLI
jgi:DNA-binding transcriptional regulator PaaX